MTLVMPGLRRTQQCFHIQVYSNQDLKYLIVIKKKI